MAYTKEGYKTLTVDLAAMRKLSVRLHSDGDRLQSLIEAMEKDVHDLGPEWESANYARFVSYFWDRYSWVEYYKDYPRDQADWLDKAIARYEQLPLELQDIVDRKLAASGG